MTADRKTSMMPTGTTATGNPNEVGRRICVTGGRDLTDRVLIEETFRQLSVNPHDTIVEGEAKGTDTLCAEVARKVGATVEPHPAKWSMYGHAAGPIRNIEMLNSGVNLLISFPGGRGTRHCTSKAREMGIPVIFAKDLVATTGEGAVRGGKDEGTSLSDEEHPASATDVPIDQQDVATGNPSEDDPWAMLLNPT